MQANEFRIGNLIDDPMNGIVPIHTIEEDSVNYIGLPYILVVPLTEEWLLKFGFEKKSLDSYEIGWDTLRLDPNDMGSYDAKEPGDFNPICNLPIQYVHQLQNLYFAIEGKELEIKEPAKV